MSPDSLRHIASRVVKSAQVGDDQAEGQFRGARIVHTRRIT